jgi:hypothetical protein
MSFPADAYPCAPRADRIAEEEQSPEANHFQLIAHVLTVGLPAYRDLFPLIDIGTVGSSFR